GGVLKLCEEIVVCDKETVDGAIEHDDFNPIVSLERRDDLIQLRNALRAKNVEGWVVEDNAPIKRRALFETDAFLAFRATHCRLLGVSASTVGVPEHVRRRKQVATSPVITLASKRPPSAPAIRDRVSRLFIFLRRSLHSSEATRPPHIGFRLLRWKKQE